MSYSADDDPYKVVETSVISQITEVRLYSSTIDHIAEEHPEVAPLSPSMEVAIADALANPTSVKRSAVERHTDSYKFCSTRHTMGDNNQLVVPIKRVAGTSALVKTAYFTETVTGENVWSEGDA